LEFLTYVSLFHPCKQPKIGTQHRNSGANRPGKT